MGYSLSPDNIDSFRRVVRNSVFFRTEVKPEVLCMSVYDMYTMGEESCVYIKAFCDQDKS